MRAMFMFVVTILIGLAVAAYLMPGGPSPEEIEAFEAGLPDAPEGWVALEGASLAQAFGGVSALQAERRYARANRTVSVALTRSEQAVAAAEAAGRNILDPQLRALSDSGNETRIIERTGWTGWAGPIDGRSEATVFRGDLLVQVAVEPAHMRTLEIFLDELDWETLAQLEPPGS